MNFNITELRKDDVVLVFHSVGSLPNKKVNKHCKKITKHLKEMFPGVESFLIPTRDKLEWDFQIIRPVE